MQDQEPSPGLRAIVLAGGQSAERDVSLSSGRCVAAALGDAGHQVTLVDPAEVDLDRFDWTAVDGCFIALHGGAGEDGRIQSRLESLGVCYTGSRPAESRLAMSKTDSKRRLIERAIPTPAFRSLSDDVPFDALLRQVAALGPRLVVKPDRQGSSLGVGFAENPSQLAVCIDCAKTYGDRLLVETEIVGRELTVAVLGRRALPVLEIIAANSFYDYQAKYHRTDTDYRFETGLSEAVLAEVQLLAVAAAEAIGTVGLVRVDLMLDRQYRPWVLELNTVPGMTDRSLAPRAAARVGIEMPELCDRLLRRCLLMETSS